MPANIAHILIANTVKDKFKKIDEETHEIILSKNNHYYLGSLGPDLPSYKTSNLVVEALNRLLVRPFVSDLNPQEEDASFFLHSTRPNLFPFYLMETKSSYTELQNDKIIKKDFNYGVYAFILGYVTHIAADQTIHRLVRSIVGPYYRSLAISQKHSECEVHQDIFLFYELYKDRKFNKIVQKELVNIDKLAFEYDQFCNMISLSISKAGYKGISKSDIDGWLDGIKMTFDLMDNIGPYVTALKNFEEQKDQLDNFPFYKKYFRDKSKDFDYMTFFEKAVNLAIKYVKEIKRLWDEMDYSFDSINKYQSIIQSDDLTSPIRKII
jgi:hypothetical protein